MKPTRTSSLAAQRLVALLALLAAPAAFAASFNITGNDTSAETLATGETGNVTATGDLNISGGTVSVTVSGGTVSLTNSGLIRQTGTGRAIDANTAGTTLTVDNSGTISSVGGNETIRLAQTSVLNLTNQLGATISSNAADAIRPGNNSTITNFGTISANPPDIPSPAGSDGIDLRTQRTGITITNSGLISGRHGIATDGANVGPSSVTVNNNAGGTITALNGSGLNIDGVSTTATANVTNALGATIKGGVFVNSTAGDGDGIDVDGVLTLNNSGDVLGLGAKGGTNNAEGIAAGGGSITNTSTGRIIGSSLLADAPNGDVSRAGNGILIDDSNVGNAIAAATITNSGLIQGKSGFGVRIIGTFADTITNNATGTIRGAGTGAAIQTGDGADIVTNRGTITGDNGSAIALEAGNDTLNILGGTATVTGNIDGGTGTNTANITPGVGNTFSYANSLTNFATVNVGPGTFHLASTASINANVTIADDGILAGTGNVLQSVTVQNGGQLAPGNSPGTLLIGGNLNLEGGATVSFDLGANPATSDLINLNGNLNFTGPGQVTFNFIDGGIDEGTYTLIAFDGTTTVDESIFAYGYLPSAFTGEFVVGANSVTFNVSAIPEPATYALLLGVGVLGLVSAQRKRRSAA
jgi:PEP-CTERM motif